MSCYASLSYFIYDFLFTTDDVWYIKIIFVQWAKDVETCESSFHRNLSMTWELLIDDAFMQVKNNLIITQFFQVWKNPCFFQKGGGWDDKGRGNSDKKNSHLNIYEYNSQTNVILLFLSFVCLLFFCVCFFHYIFFYLNGGGGRWKPLWICQFTCNVWAWIKWPFITVLRGPLLK